MQTLDPLGDGLSAVTLTRVDGSDLDTVNSARVSFDGFSERMTERDERLVAYLARHHHTSPFRHAHVQLRVKAPISSARQLYKHVVGIETLEFDGLTLQHITPDGSFKDHGYNEISLRYVPARPEVYVPRPGQWRRQAESNRQASVADNGGTLNQATLTHAVTWKTKEDLRFYRDLIAQGVTREQARFYLPLALYTEWVWTLTLQAVLHCIALRDHEGAQWEARQYGRAMAELIGPHFPVALREWRSGRGTA